MFNLRCALFLMTILFCGASSAADTLDPRLFQELKVRMATNYGDIELELFPKESPITVKNFLRYIDEGFYNETIFHRVIKDFMIQGGGFTAQYQLKPSNSPIKNESDNGLRNTKGTIAMARTRDPHSANSQFFINTQDNPNLDMVGDQWGYSVFGRVIKGMNIVEEISHAPTGPAGPFPSDAPQGLIIIKSISVIAADTSQQNIPTQKKNQIK